MALSRKKVTAPIEIVLLHDPAIDTENSDLMAYIQDYDINHLKYLESQKPTIFVIKQLTDKQKDFLEQFSSDKQARQLAKWTVKFGLVNVNNFLIDQDGTIIEVEPIQHETIPGVPGPVVKDSWLEKLDLGNEDLAGLKIAIVLHSEARSPLSRPSGVKSGSGA